MLGARNEKDVGLRKQLNCFEPRRGLAIVEAESPWTRRQLNRWRRKPSARQKVCVIATSAVSAAMMMKMQSKSADHQGYDDSRAASRVSHFEIASRISSI